MGQFQYAPLGIMCIDFDLGIRLNDLIHTAGEGVNSTIIQCVHEQSYWITKSLTKSKNTQSLKMKH